MNKESAAKYAAAFTPKQKSRALLVVALAFVMDLLDATIVNIAIPSIQVHLHTSFAAIQWLIAGYALTFALLLITGGRMGDVFGYRKVFLTGVAGFTVASFLGGIAPNSSVLVMARLLQGSMAALMVPQVMSLLQVMYSPAERVKVMGLFGMLGGLAGSLGPILGGLLIRLNLFGWSWRPIFLINIPVGILAFIVATYALPKGASSHSTRLDIPGTGLVMLALGLLVFPLIEGRELNWPAWSIGMLVAALPTFITFGVYELRQARHGKSPLIVPDLFKIPTFSRGVALNMVLTAVMISFFLTFTLMLQVGLGFNVLRAALTALPTAFGIGGSIAIGSQLIPKIGARVVALGSIISAGGLLGTAFMFDHYGTALHAWQLIPALLINGVGIGLMIAAMSSIALQEVDPGHAGAASGIFNAVQQVGGALGVALIGIVFFGHLSNNAHPLAANFAHAYRAGVLFELFLLAVLFTLSFALPKHLKLVEAA